MELIKEYIKKYGYDPTIQYFKYMLPDEIMKHLKKANGRELIFENVEDTEDGFVLKYV